MFLFWRRLKIAWKNRGWRGRMRRLEDKVWGYNKAPDLDSLLLLNDPLDQRLDELAHKVEALAQHVGVVLHKSTSPLNPYRALKPEDVPKERSVRARLYDYYEDEGFGA